jgi:hypothetical protein
MNLSRGWVYEWSFDLGGHIDLPYRDKCIHYDILITATSSILDLPEFQATKTPFL